MSSLREAIYSRLHGDATLTAMLAEPTAIYHRLAPKEAAYPFAVFHKMTAPRQLAFNGGELRWPIWLVKAVDRSPNASRAEEIDERIEALLDNAPVTVSGFTNSFLRREMDLPESTSKDDMGEILQEPGGLYRFSLDPIS